MIKVYGIPNCNTVKKTLDYFKSKNLDVAFHNYKTEGISEEKLEQWLKSEGINKVVNKKGTTFRNLSDAEKEALESPQTALAVLKEKTSVIKRPIVEFENKTLVGFDANEYDEVFK